MFDVGLNAFTTKNAGLYLLDDYNNYLDVVTGDAEGGFIYMDSFLKYDEAAATQIAGNDFYGNGRIEGIYYDGNVGPDDYTVDLVGIAGQVANWLNDYNLEHVGQGFDSAFDAFKNGDDNVVVALTNIYTGANA